MSWKLVFVLVLVNVSFGEGIASLANGALKKGGNGNVLSVKDRFKSFCKNNQAYCMFMASDNKANQVVDTTMITEISEEREVHENQNNVNDIISRAVDIMLQRAMKKFSRDKELQWHGPPPADTGSYQGDTERNQNKVGGLPVNYPRSFDRSDADRLRTMLDNMDMRISDEDSRLLNRLQANTIKKGPSGYRQYKHSSLSGYSNYLATKNHKVKNQRKHDLLQVRREELLKHMIQLKDILEREDRINNNK